MWRLSEKTVKLNTKLAAMDLGLPKNPKTLLVRGLILLAFGAVYTYWLRHALADTLELPDLFSVFLTLGLVHLVAAGYYRIKG